MKPQSISPTPWNRPKPPPMRLAVKYPKGNTTTLHMTARRRRMEAVRLWDEGHSVEAIVELTGQKVGMVRRYTRDLPTDQCRDRYVAAQALAAIGTTPQEWNRLRRNVDPNEVWRVVLAMLEFRSNAGRPLSLGAIADALHTNWRYVAALMDKHGYSRGIREDHR